VTDILFPPLAAILEHRADSSISSSFYSRYDSKVTGDWRRLHNEELHNLYSSRNIIRMIRSRRMRWAGHEARMREKSNAYRILVGMPEGKIPLGRPRRRWVDSSKLDLRETGWGGMD
jgi:hypothetical protein